MTPEERLACRFKDLFIRGPEGMKLIQAVSEATSLIKEAQREAVEKTLLTVTRLLDQRWCYCVVCQEDERRGDSPIYLFKQDLLLLTPEKVLGEG